MPEHDLPVEVLSSDGLRPRAADFLREHHAAGTIPIPIEEIIELRLGIDITVTQYLREECDVDAFINSTCRVIYVDTDIYMASNESRYRFSLAHELAHVILHGAVMERLQFNTLDEWKEAVASVPPEQYK